MTTEDNVKTEVSNGQNGTESNATESNDLKYQVRRQVEYYFGDLNLPRDKFLQEEMKKDDGWIELTTMLKFNRLAKLTQDVKVLADALKDSKLIEVSEDDTKIRRSPEVPLPDNTLEYWTEIKHRTAYIKGFDVKDTLDDVQKFVSPYKVHNVVMRRLHKERTFKGSVFVTFADVETAKKFVDDSNHTTFKDKPMTKLMQDDYWKKKSSENKVKKEERKSAKEAKKLEQIAEQERSVLAAHFVKGVVLEVSGFDSQNTKYEDLKTFFKKYGPVAFVAYENGNENAKIRFDDGENSAKKAWENALEKNDGKIMFKDQELTGKVLEGEEEEKYWADFTKTKVARQDQFGKNNKKSARGYNARKRPSQRCDAFERKAKHTKFEDEDNEVEA
ncbi:hypothetical protein M3Y96_00829800 [Aphelenchoides besseyi]|nr:hypothetical protein M3Y96_00829800 [Aphelenchoides besseyi]